MSDKEKFIKREYGRNRYRNMLEEDKQKVREYKKICKKSKAIKISLWFFVCSVKDE